MTTSVLWRRKRERVTGFELTKSRYICPVIYGRNADAGVAEGKPAPENSKTNLKNESEFKPGDKIWQVNSPFDWLGPPVILEYTLKSITDQNYISTSGGRITIGFRIFGDFEKAKAEWTDLVESQIVAMERALKKGPQIDRHDKR